MASYKSISITFGNALAQAQKLESSAEQMRNASQKLESIEESLRSEWEGESASLYLQKCDALKQKLEKTAGDLVQIAAVIRKSAKSYRDAEIKALQAIATKGKG
ncbi:WXG100 family type VII secretion target [Hominisplanchenecus sp.]|jgi:WXG100 family type VII secretion target|uniref:WXG100 family type VII secretion target n=1 Tax=Hominisplanchenecus sp. TaxID=3038130 RepID=UPI00399207F9